jgi:hypothetical protein
MIDQHQAATIALLFRDHKKTDDPDGVPMVKVHYIGQIGNAQDGFSIAALVELENGDLMEVEADRLRIIQTPDMVVLGMKG